MSCCNNNKLKLKASKVVAKTRRRCCLPLSAGFCGPAETSISFLDRVAATATVVSTTTTTTSTASCAGTTTVSPRLLAIDFLDSILWHCFTPHTQWRGFCFCFCCCCCVLLCISLYLLRISHVDIALIATRLKSLNEFF